MFVAIGTAEIASDPMPPNVADIYVMLKPRDAWPKPRRSKAELIEAMERTLALLPGNAYEFTQPIEMRFNELIAGVRGDVAVKVFGDDLDVMLGTAERGSAEILRSIREPPTCKSSRSPGCPCSRFKSIAPLWRASGSASRTFRTWCAPRSPAPKRASVRRRSAIRHRRATPGDRPARPACARDAAGSRRGGAAHDVRRRSARTTPGGADGVRAPRSRAAIHLEEGPNQVSRENGKRRVVVQANVRGRDLGSFVAEAQGRVGREVRVPSGYWLAWGGQFENLIAARTRLSIVVPLALLSIFVLLFAAFGSIKEHCSSSAGCPLR